MIPHHQVSHLETLDCCPCAVCITVSFSEQHQCNALIVGSPCPVEGRSFSCPLRHPRLISGDRFVKMSRAGGRLAESNKHIPELMLGCRPFERCSIARLFLEYRPKSRSCLGQMRCALLQPSKPGQRNAKVPLRLHPIARRPLARAFFESCAEGQDSLV